MPERKIQHFRTDGSTADGFYCTNCGVPGVDVNATGHLVDNEWVCKPNPTLVKELSKANSGFYG